MADVVALLQTDPSLLRCQLHRLDAAIDLDAHVGDALGVGYYDGGKVLLRKRPVTGPLQLEALGQDIRSEVFVSTWHAAGPNGFREEDTAPYRFRNWLFAGQGTLVPPAEATQMIAALPEFLQRALDPLPNGGASEAEIAFFLTLAQVHAQGHKLEHPEMEPEVLAVALGRTLSQLDRRAVERSQPRPQTTALMSNGRMLVALRRGKPLSYGLLEGFADCPVCGIDRDTSDRDPRVRAHRMLKAVAVTTRARKDGIQWIEVPEGHVLTVGRSLAARIAPMVTE
jgi:glutamine amidotransferase